MKTERQELLEQRKRQRKEYGVLFDEISKLLFTLDPVGISFEENFDEYDLEVGTILPRLKGITEKEKIEVVVREEFHRWFDLDEGDDLADEMYDLIANGIHKILVKSNSIKLNGEPGGAINSEAAASPR